MKKNTIKALCFLHLLLVIYSITGIFSKIAASQSFLSFEFCICYATIIGLLGIYAIGWQQIIKQLPLTVAFANKAVTIVWNIVWGVLFFQETISVGKLIGVVLVICGVILFVTDPKEMANE